MRLLRFLFFTILLALASACTSSGVTRRDIGGVERLNLRDPRLPMEARRWLADAEDEVAIAQAHVDDAKGDLRKLENYRGSVVVRLDEAWSTGKSGSAAEGEAAAGAFFRYADQRVDLAELELKISRKQLELTIARLTQARAETAIRYDLAVYEIEPIVREVEQLKSEVAAIQREVEEQRVKVEKAADEVWKAYTAFASKGGATDALWGTP